MAIPCSSAPRLPLLGAIIRSVTKEPPVDRQHQPPTTPIRINAATAGTPMPSLTDGKTPAGNSHRQRASGWNCWPAPSGHEARTYSTDRGWARRAGERRSGTGDRTLGTGLN